MVDVTREHCSSHEKRCEIIDEIKVKVSELEMRVKWLEENKADIKEIINMNRQIDKIGYQIDTLTRDRKEDSQQIGELIASFQELLIKYENVKVNQEYTLDRLDKFENALMGLDSKLDENNREINVKLEKIINAQTINWMEYFKDILTNNIFKKFLSISFIFLLLFTLLGMFSYYVFGKNLFPFIFQFFQSWIGGFNN